MKHLYDLIASHEDWLTRRVFHYASARGYAKYTSESEGPWRESVAGLSESLLAALPSDEQPLEFGPDDDLKKDAVASFGMVEAQKHRRASGTLELFLGLLVYFRQSYIDLVHEKSFDRDDERRYSHFIGRFFDRLELGFCAEWAASADSELAVEPRAAGLPMVSEANNQLEVLDSLPNSIILLDKHNHVVNMNRAALEFVRSAEDTEASWRSEAPIEQMLPWLAKELTAFRASPESEISFEKQLRKPTGVQHFLVKLTRMQDTRGEFNGAVVILSDTTALKQVEQTAIGERLRYQTLVESADDAVFTKDAEGRFTSVNSELARRLSRRKDGIVGKTAWELYPPETARLIADEESKVLKQGIVVESEHAYTTPFGLVAQRVRKVPLRDDAGTVIGLVGIASDISEYKRAEEALRQGEEHFRSLTDSIADVSAMLGQAGTIRSISPSVERVLGYQSEELIGKHVFAITHSDDEAGLRDALDRVTHSPGTAVSVEIRGRHKDGSYRILELMLTNHLSNPAVSGIITKAIDHTERRKAEDALAKARDFYLALLDEFPAPIWRSGIDAQCHYFNKSWLEFTGRTLEQEIGDGWMEGVHPDDLERRTRAYLDAFNARRPYEAEYRLRRYDGEYRWMVDLGRLYCDLDGNFAGYIGSCYDITDRKIQEEQLGYLAAHDPLTRLPNRRLLEDALTRAVARARRGTKSTLLFLDLDDFKFVNDTFGHSAGDQVLMAVARLLQEHLRAEDLLARFAGDEFAVLLEGTDIEEARVIAERNRRKVEEYEFSISDHQFHLSVSTGAVAIDGQESPGLLMSHADNAMYAAKEQGRNRVVLYRSGSEA